MFPVILHVKTLFGIDLTPLVVVTGNAATERDQNNFGVEYSPKF